MSRSWSFLKVIFVMLFSCLFSVVAQSAEQSASKPVDTANKPDVEYTVEDVKKFLDKVNLTLKKAFSERERASFVNLTYITDDTNELVAQATERTMALISSLNKEAQKFSKVKKLPEDLKRQLQLLKIIESMPAPDNALLRSELAQLSSELSAMYGKGRYCQKTADGKIKKCYRSDEIQKIFATEKDEAKLKEFWVGWHHVGADMRKPYLRLVELMNQGAKDNGFLDVSMLWKANYDMPADKFEAETDRLWTQLKPLYDQLHCYVRSQLSSRYGKDKVPVDGLIPAHLLGNVWAQEWNNIYDLVAPYPREPSINVDKTLASKKYTPEQMVKMGETFFTSLGLPKLPDTFWTRSMLKRPEGRDVECHASAWDITMNGDLRIKMCITPTEEHLITIHHELGHVFYYQQYKDISTLFQQGANDGFHEGIGDTITLSMTPAYLKKIDLLSSASESEKSLINNQMKSALEKIAFLPFGLVLDKFRWELFSGRIKNGQVNTRFWELRKKYQGIEPPVVRTEDDFDAGAKYHIPANTPYMRYFLARILQFQMHRGLCKAAGHKGPIHTCSIFGNQIAGDKLKQMLAMGASKPWPEALAVVTGEKKMDAKAILEYYQPLMTWLQKQNQKQQCGFSVK